MSIVFSRVSLRVFVSLISAFNFFIFASNMEQISLVVSRIIVDANTLLASMASSSHWYPGVSTLHNALHNKQPILIPTGMDINANPYTIVDINKMKHIFIVQSSKMTANSSGSGLENMFARLFV